MTKNLLLIPILLGLAGCASPRAEVVEEDPAPQRQAVRSAEAPALPGDPFPLRDPDVVSELPGDVATSPGRRPAAAGGSGGTVIAQPPGASRDPD